MDDEVKKYKLAITELEKIFVTVAHISANIMGRQAQDRKQEFGSIVFTKICCHCHSVLQLVPRQPIMATTEPELWDISSIASIGRALLESYYSFFYLSVDVVDEDMEAFRWLLWDYSCEFKRLQQLELIGSQSPLLSDLRREVEALKNTLVESSIFKRQTESVRRKMTGGQMGVFSTNTDLSQRAGISKKYYKLLYDYLSSYVHSYSLSINQLQSFRAGSAEAVHIIALLARYCLVYMCFSLRDITQLFPDQKLLIDNDVKGIMDDWIDIARNFRE
ncbi:MAG: DUF5677 domain-containing protein [Rhodospirillaceae bacterium]